MHIFVLAALSAATVLQSPTYGVTLLGVDAGRLRELEVHELDCGPNSLYVLLTLLGYKVDRQDLKESLCSVSDGANMDMLRRAAKRFGASSYVIKETPPNLPSCSLPAIAHLEGGAGTGHFVTLVAVDAPNFIHAIDGTTGDLVRWDYDSFCRYWSGYLLVAKPATARLAWISVMACWALNIALWRWGVGVLVRAYREQPKHG